MNTIKLLSVFLLSAFAILNISCAKGDMGNTGLHQKEDEDTTADFRTYVYKDIDNHALKLDVFMPPGNPGKLLPVIIFFHGGGWTSGNRTYFYKQCRYFSKHGIIAVTADYRLMQKGVTGIEGTKEICIRDAKSAVRWVKSHAAQFHLDTGKVILSGGSAGGHLATMAALDKKINDPSDDTAISTSACALVLFNPAYNLNQDPALQPFTLITSAMPPTILFFGSRDKWKKAADSLYTQMKQKNITGEMWVANGQTHAFFNKEPWNTATCIKAHAFLVKQGLMSNDIPALPAGADLFKE